MLFRNGSVISDGLLFAGGVESDAVSAIGSIISRECRIIYRFHLLESSGCDIDLNVNGFSTLRRCNYQTASVIIKKDLIYFCEYVISILSYNTIRLLKECISKSYFNIVMISNGNGMLIINQ